MPKMGHRFPHSVNFAEMTKRLLFSLLEDDCSYQAPPGSAWSLMSSRIVKKGAGRYLQVQISLFISVTVGFAKGTSFRVVFFLMMTII